MKLFNEELHMENLYLKQDEKTGLIAIIAVHNTKMGPALGGCRFVRYSSVDDAMIDAMRLAKAMTYKSSMAGLPLGGGKSVIVLHPGISDRTKLFESFGEFVESLKGKYITASDSGTSEEDMRIVATRTHYVTSINKSNEKLDDTAFMTATGLVKAIEAAVARKLEKENLKDVHIAIQGMGSVGYLVTNMLLEKGAKITICDTNQKLIAERTKNIPVKIVDPAEITAVECDVFSPCALGGIINQSFLKMNKAPIICGAANNQLQDPAVGEALFKQDVLFVPDYVANAGGVICAAAQAGVISKEDSHQKVNNIYNSVSKIIEMSADLKLPPYVIANDLAEATFLA